MGQMKTPGVYIVEKNAFPNSVVEVATAVPAFIGYTEKAENGANSLKNKPWRITSMAEFLKHYGGAPFPKFSIEEKAASEENKNTEADFTVAETEYLLKQTSGKFLLYYSMLMFFRNGGGPCYIISIGNYNSSIDEGQMTKAVDLLIKEQEPTMIVIPDSVLLELDSWANVQTKMLGHCGGKMRNRVSIIDVYEGYKDRQDPSLEGNDLLTTFREKVGTNYLDFGTAYYPWLNTSIVTGKELGYLNIDNKDVLQKLISSELKIPETVDDNTDKKIKLLSEELSKISNAELKDEEKTPLNKTLIQISPLFNTILDSIKKKLNLLPPGAAMAGIYTMVDNTRGVWKAPANVSINSVVSPTVNITHDDQEDLNVPLSGKSINAIRAFIGEGTIVWGARTLDGNSQDWRYVNVRRTMIMLEESIKIAAKAYVFEPNEAKTWVSIKSMIDNFLNGIWKRGGLAGASPEDAYSVHVGLGDTMTPNDILDGIMRITVLVAVSRPAEFIEITFQQQMQKS